LAALLLTTLKGAWREAKKTSDLSLVIKMPVIDFPREEGGIRRAYALQLQQHQSPGGAAENGALRVAG